MHKYVCVCVCMCTHPSVIVEFENALANDITKSISSLKKKKKMVC